MKIANVSVNEKKLPSREDLVKLALLNKKNKNNLQKINAEIDGTGLFKSAKPKIKKSDSTNSGHNRLSNERQRKLDKGKD